MTISETQPGSDSLTHLSDVLNKLAGRERLTISEMEGERKKLADMAVNFNGASAPAAEKLAESLPAIGDYGSRWIAARMLRDTGLKDEKQGDFALTALCAALATEKDSGSRYMLASLVRDLGLAHESLAVTAAAAIAGALGREKDHYAIGGEKNSLVALGMKYEAAAAIGVSGLAKALLDNPDPFTRTLLAGDLRDLGLVYSSQASAAIKNLAKAAEKESDMGVARHLAQNIAAVALKNPATTAQAVEALSAGVSRETKSDAVFAYSHALMQVGEAHPLPVIVAMEEGLCAFKGKTNNDKRRSYIVNLSGLADMGATESAACSKVLLGALKDEPESHHRRLIINGLMTCVRNGIDPLEVKRGLWDQQSLEKDRETRDVLDRSLRSLGYVKPFTNVVNFQPATASAL